MKIPVSTTKIQPSRCRIRRLFCFTSILIAFVTPAKAGRFELQKYGISFEAPDGWLAPSPEMIAVITRHEGDRIAKKHLMAPDISVLKYPEPYHDVNPTVAIRVDPISPWGGWTPSALLIYAMSLARQLSPDAKIIEPPTATFVAGIPAARGLLQLSNTIDGINTSTRMSEWIILKGSHCIFIYGSYRSDEKNGSRREIENIVESLKIDPAK